MNKINSNTSTNKSNENQNYYKFFKKKSDMQANKTLREFAKARIFKANDSPGFSSGLKLDDDSETEEQQKALFSPFTPK